MLPALFTVAATAQLNEEPPEVQRIIDYYDLAYLEGESGYFAVRGQSAFAVDTAGETLPAHSSIYYLLTRRHPVNYLHWLASDDTQILVEGGPLDYFIFLPDGTARRVRVGGDRDKGEVAAVTIPGNSLKAIILAPEADYALLVNVLTPAWTPERVRIGREAIAESVLLERYAGKAAWATPAFLRSLLPEDSPAGENQDPQ